MHLKMSTIIERKDNESRTPLYWATRNGHINMMRLLLEKGANVNALDKDGRTHLHWAVDDKHDVMKLFLEKGAYVNAQDTTGLTPLHWTAINGHQLIT